VLISFFTQSRKAAKDSFPFPLCVSAPLRADFIFHAKPQSRKAAKDLPLFPLCVSAPLRAEFIFHAKPQRIFLLSHRGLKHISDHAASRPPKENDPQ
jgi:hypothetical protein